MSIMFGTVNKLSYDGSDKLSILEDCVNNHSVKYANGIVAFNDATKTIVVDTVAGRVGHTDVGDVQYYITGSKSIKKNGYVYAVIDYYHMDGTIHSMAIGQHVIVAMAAHLAEYQLMIANGIKPEVCHKNSCPWDNKADNLEWGDRWHNSKQGKLGISMEHYYAGVYTSIVIKGNGTFTVLDRPIENAWIDMYLQSIGKNKKHLYLPRHTDCLDKTIVDDFIKWLIQNKLW